MFQALHRMKEPGYESPKPDTKDYWLQRCVIAEAALQKHVGDKEKGMALMDMASVNLKTDSYTILPCPPPEEIDLHAADEAQDESLLQPHPVQ